MLGHLNLVAVCTVYLSAYASKNLIEIETKSNIVKL